MPRNVREAWFNKYNEYTVHLMPLIRNCYYVKQMAMFEDCSQSQSSYCEYTEDEKQKKEMLKKQVPTPADSPAINTLKAMPAELDYALAGRVHGPMNEDASRAAGMDTIVPGQKAEAHYGPADLGAARSAEHMKIRDEKAFQDTPYVNPLAKMENSISAADSSVNALNPIELQSLSQNFNTFVANNQYGLNNNTLE